jgi:hypothetical protein
LFSEPALAEGHYLDRHQQASLRSQIPADNLSYGVKATVVCFHGGKVPTRHNLGAASLISFVMVAEVSSINTFLTQANLSGMIKDEELLFQEWNRFEHLARQREEI